MNDMIQASTLIAVLAGMSEESLEDFLAQYDEEWVNAILYHAEVDQAGMNTTDEQLDAVREIVVNYVY